MNPLPLLLLFAAAAALPGASPSSSPSSSSPPGDSTPAAWAAAHASLGQQALERDDIATAVRELEAAVALVPNNAADHDFLGQAYGRTAKKAALLTKFVWARKCLAQFQRAVALDPSRPEYHEHLFEYYRRSPPAVGGGTGKARAEAAAIARLDPERGHLAYATLDQAAGKFDEAFAELDQALALAPNDYSTLYEIGHLASLTGQHLTHGLACLRRCLELPAPPGAPSHASAQWRIDLILQKQGDNPRR